MLAMVASDALACPVCTYERVMPGWVLFAAFRFLVVIIVMFAVLDAVRVVEAFIVYEIIYFYAWRYAVWYSHPAVTDGPMEILYSSALFLLSAGVPAALLAYGLGRLKWFRKEPDRGVSWKRAILVVPAMFLLSLMQSIMTYR